jgi:hypothetical protein
MNSGSYFTNLMSTSSFYSTSCGDDDAQPSQNYDDLSDTQPHDEVAIQKDGPTARKEKKRRRNCVSRASQKIHVKSISFLKHCFQYNQSLFYGPCIYHTMQ